MIIRDKCIFRRRIIVSNIVIISPYQIFLLSFFNPTWPVLQLSVSKAEIYKLGSDPGVVQDLGHTGEKAMEEVYSSSQMLLTCLSAFLIGLWGICSYLFLMIFW